MSLLPQEDSKDEILSVAKPHLSYVYGQKCTEESCQGGIVKDDGVLIVAKPHLNFVYRQSAQKKASYEKSTAQT